MKCSEAKKQIVSCLDGELRQQDERTMYHHLSVCDSCSEYMDSMSQIDGMLKDSLTPVDAPPNFTQQVMLRLEAELAGEKDCCVVKEEPEDMGLSQEKTWKRWLPSLSNGWLKTGIAASMAVVLLFGGLGLSGSAYMDEPFPKRVVLVSKDGISEIRRVVDNVIQIAQGDKRDENKVATVKKPDAKNPGGAIDHEGEHDGSDPVGDGQATGEGLPAVEEPGPGVGDFDIALQEELSGKPQVAEEDKSAARNKSAAGKKSAAAEDNSTLNSADSEVSKVSMTAVVSPVIVIHGIDNLRPVWVDNDTIFYLSERNTPRDGTYTIWETDGKGITRRMVSAPGYYVELEKEGGVWSSYFQNYAFATNRNGHWELTYSSLKGAARKAVQSDNSGAGKPASGALWEYNPVPSANGELAFLTKRFGNVDLMAVDHQGNLRVLTKTTEVNESNPAWSTDGSKIAYVSTPVGSQTSRVMVADKNGQGAVAVTPSLPTANMVPVWSENGREIAVNVGNAGGKSGLWLANSDGSDWRKITDKGGGDVVAWSPNGSMIAFTDAKSRLYVWDVTRGADDPEAIIKVAPSDQDGKVNYVCWSPDSKRLLLEWDGAQTKTNAIWRAEILSFGFKK